MISGQKRAGSNESWEPPHYSTVSYSERINFGARVMALIAQQRQLVRASRTALDESYALLRGDGSVKITL